MARKRSGYGLFPDGVGNTQKDAARFTSLIDDVESKIFARLPDATWVYPGHGSDTTLGAERPHLAEWRERDWQITDDKRRAVPTENVRRNYAARIASTYR